MNGKCWFDDSLSLFASILVEELGLEQAQAGVVLRDVQGLLAFIAQSKILKLDRLRIAKRLVAELSPYVRGSRAVLGMQDPIAEAILSVEVPFQQIVELASGTSVSLRVLEHRIVGQDWLRPPAAEPSAGPHRFVFASLKGGVGRTTAAAVAASELARDGKKILVLDLDLEAPGIGSLLLTPDETPRFGMLDWYVESSLQVLEPEFLAEMVATSSLSSGAGLIDVVPAVGRRSNQNPANVLQKIARAYLEVPQPNGRPKGFLSRTDELVVQLAGLNTYDAVFVDARAGLSEITAAAVLGLGAEVLLFGVDTPQTFASTRFLLSSLSAFPRDPSDDWVDRIRLIHAKASADGAHQESFRDRAYTMFQEHIYREQSLLDAEDKPVLDADGREQTLPEYTLDDPLGPHYAWPILLDSQFAEFDPLGKPDQLSFPWYERTFALFLDGIRSRLQLRSST